MGAASGYKNSFNPQFLTSSDRRVRQIDPLRDATMLKMLDEIARDDTFRIEGMKKGSEKAVFENVNTLALKNQSSNISYNNRNKLLISLTRCIQMFMLTTMVDGSKCSL